ncbi:MAG: hypothetical protein HGGPFJEG_03067 [Ignavibacteria bacterium]|nr:hypothetical protein [Ignavibacteria bacterium]
MVNLNTVLEDLIEFIKAALAFRHVQEYSNEYEGDTGNWTEKHPSCFVEVNGFFPVSKDSEKNTAASRIDFLLLIANKTTAVKHPLQLVSELLSALEGQEFVYPDAIYYARLKSINLFARDRDLKVYALRCELTL